MTIDKTLLAAGVAALLFASGALGKTAPRGYLVDAAGNIVLTGYGDCIRTGEWTPALAVPQCAAGLAERTPGAAAPLVSFAVEALFDFDQSELTPEGQRLLDRLAQTLRTTDYDVVVATGHADRLGPADYNRELSARRSDAVKAYLTSKGVEPGRIQARAAGELKPLTRPADCSGDRANLIECLQPDRRVDVEASGYRSQTESR